MSGGSTMTAASPCLFHTSSQQGAVQLSMEKSIPNKSLQEAVFRVQATSVQPGQQVRLAQVTSFNISGQQEGRAGQGDQEHGSSACQVQD